MCLCGAIRHTVGSVEQDGYDEKNTPCEPNESFVGRAERVWDTVKGIFDHVPTIFGPRNGSGVLSQLLKNSS